MKSKVIRARPSAARKMFERFEREGDRRILTTARKIARNKAANMKEAQ